MDMGAENVETPIALLKYLFLVGKRPGESGDIGFGGVPL